MHERLSVAPSRAVRPTGDEFALPASSTTHGVLQDASLCIRGIWH